MKDVNKIEDVVNKIVSKWKKIIESYSIKVESVTFFRMPKYYRGYPEIEYCYKVTFDFGLDSGLDSDQKINRDIIMKEIELNFINRFQPINDHTDFLAGNCNLEVPQKVKNINAKIILDNEIKFNNDKVDYFTNQGHRIIIQFYPHAFIDELREDKLNQLGIM
jgi:hypothetical protein